MRLGINLGYWGPNNRPDEHLTMAIEADRLGYDSLWVAEAYGSDCVSVLAWIGALTERIDLGAAIMQIPARTPAMTAMTATTLDTLSGGRFRLGLGVSGPQVSEGWHGVRFDAPLARTREYVEIVRMALRRETVRYSGEHFTLPLPDGPGKALKLSAKPPRADLPIYLAAVGPKNLRLTGEIADGWLGIFVSPRLAPELLGDLRAGRARRETAAAEAGTQLAPFDVVATVPVVLDDDVERAADALRGYCALYIGGMGSRERNFYNQLAVRMGFEQEAAEVQDLFLAGEHRAAAAAVPFDFIDETALIGPPARIRERAQRYADAGVTTLAATLFADQLDDRLAALRLLADGLSSP